MRLRLQPRLPRLFVGQLIVAFLLSIVAAAAAAQPREVRRGDLVLRSSTVSSERISAETASRHGIDPAPNRAVLNVVLMRGKNRQPIRAEVTASSRNLAGVRQEIEMREVRENERVSYIGVYEFLPREVIDIEIRAKPLRPAEARPLALRYRERMWQR